MEKMENLLRLEMVAHTSWKNSMKKLHGAKNNDDPNIINCLTNSVLTYSDLLQIEK